MLNWADNDWIVSYFHVTRYHFIFAHFASHYFIHVSHHQHRRRETSKVVDGIVGIVGIMQLTGTVTNICYEYVGTVNGALNTYLERPLRPEECSRVARALSQAKSRKRDHFTALHDLSPRFASTAAARHPGAERDAGVPWYRPVYYLTFQRKRYHKPHRQAGMSQGSFQVDFAWRSQRMIYLPHYPTGTRMINQLLPGLCRPTWKDTVNQHERIWRIIEWTRSAWPELDEINRSVEHLIFLTKGYKIAADIFHELWLLLFWLPRTHEANARNGGLSLLTQLYRHKRTILGYLQTLYGLLATKYCNLAARERIS